MSIPNAGFACPSPSRSELSLESVRRRTRPDATIEYYRLVPGQYLNLPVEDNNNSSRRRALSSGTTQRVAQTNGIVISSSHSITVDTYQTHFRSSSSPAATSTESHRASTSTSQSSNMFSRQPGNHSTPPTTANNTPFTAHKSLAGATHRGPPPLNLANKPPSVTCESDDQVSSSRRAFASCQNSPKGSSKSLKSLRNSAPVSYHCS